MKLIVGLGNPGKEYKNTRHNIGFMVIDCLLEYFNFPPLKHEEKFKADVTFGSCEKEKIILVKPTTFMNLSGESVYKIAQFYKIDPSNIWVIYDDLDLPLGQLRIRAEGSAGTHNGMRSVVESLNTTTFPRLRLGIESRGATAPQKQETTSFVLSSFSKEEEFIYKKSIKKAAEAIETALKKGIKSAMDTFNGQ